MNATNTNSVENGEQPFKESYTPINNRAYYGAYLNSAINNIENVKEAFYIRFGVKFDDAIASSKLSTVDFERYNTFLSTYFPILKRFDRWLLFKEELRTLLLYDDIERVKEEFNNHFQVKFDDAIASSKLSAVDFERYYTFLSTYFPILKRFDREQPFKEELRILQKMFKYVNSLRNYFTHPFHVDIAHENDNLNTLLDRCILKTALYVKDKKVKGDNTRELLKTSLVQELNTLKEQRKQELNDKANQLVERAEEAYPKEKKKRLEKQAKALRNSANNSDELMNGVLNDAFRHFLYKEENETQLSDRYSANPYIKSEFNLLESKIGISINGLIFLVCCFLSRKEGEEFRAKLKYFKSRVNKDQSNSMTSLGFMATHWIFSHNAFKGLRHRMNTHFTKETLLAQLVDELSKVPDEVYRNLTKEGKEEFLEDMNEYIQESDTPQTLDSSRVIHPVIRKRYEDKFVYFVLRYLDEFVNFPTLRFQVHFANYIKDKRTKELEVINVTTEREVKVKIHAFGKLSTIQEQRDLAYSKLEETDRHWELFPNPSYNLIGENIPIAFLTKVSEAFTSEQKQQRNKKLCKTLSQLFNKPTKYNKQELLKQLVSCDEILYTRPVMLLSRYELPALLHALLVLKKTPLEVEEHILGKVNEKAKLFEEMASTEVYSDALKERVRNSDVPKQFIAALTDPKWKVNTNTTDFEKLARQIDRELECTNNKLAENQRLHEEANGVTKGNNNKQNTGIYSNSAKGEIATWLADDIKRMMLSSSIKEWKSYMHVHLQVALAFFEDVNKQINKEALQLVKDFFQFNGYNKFVKNALEQKTFEAMYTTYLMGRREYINQLKLDVLIKRKESEVVDKRLSSFFYKRTYTILPLEELAKAILDCPIVLKRGTFDDRPTYYKRGIYNIDANPEMFARWYIYARNYSPVQSFYGMNLLYADNYKEVYAQDTIEEKTFRKFKMNQDKEIRAVRTQDIFLKLMLDDIYYQIFNHKTDVNLADIYVSKAERNRELLKAEAQSKRSIGDKSTAIYKETSLWSKNFTVTYSKNYELTIHKEEPISDRENYLLIDEQVKLRDIGKFKYLIAIDKKVSFLLNEQPIAEGKQLETPWTRALLEQELDSYKVVRSDEIFQQCQELENHILKLHNFDGVHYPEQFLLDGNPNFRKVMVNGLLGKFVEKGELNETPLIINREEMRELSKKEGHELFKTTDFYDNLTDDVVKDVFLVILIRNKFSHNQYPSKPFMDVIFERVKSTEAYQKGEVKSYAQAILLCLTKLIESLKEKLNKNKS